VAAPATGDAGSRALAIDPERAQQACPWIEGGWAGANPTFGSAHLYLKRGQLETDASELKDESRAKEEAAMTAAEFELIEETGVDPILLWRFEELVRAGYDVDSALVLASHVEVDLHDATALKHRGCPPRTALRILL
jgi:hypothetical protein